MKLLKNILYKTPLLEVIGTTNLAISSLTFDSRKVMRDGLFFAISGTQNDGHQYIDQVIQNGATAIVCEQLPAVLFEHITYVKVQNSSYARGVISSNFYDNPSEKIKIVGVTGTNGKTTTATLLFQMFRKLGYKVGLLSTVQNQINGEILPSTHTTPDALSLNTLLHEMVNRGCSHCFMEVSSHALVQHRVAGIHFAGAIFTNITHDHLDYHKTMNQYILAKKLLFDHLGEDAFALVNKDDANGMVMLQNTKALKYTYALKNNAKFKCKIVESQLIGLCLNIDGNEVWTRLIGEFNAYNLLAVYAAGILLKENKVNVLTSLSILSPVEGRFEYVRSEKGVIGIVDYAHTPDALKNILTTINEIRTGNESVFVVIGCGGDRDKTKRPLMSKIACDLATKVILTSDNPRSEEPEAIVDDMKAGVEPHNFKKSIVILDRREAIKTACAFAQPGDIILLAGKGHEKYQEIKGVKYPFDDFETLKENLTLIEK